MSASTELHPDDLVDRERLGVLSPDEIHALSEHRRVCSICALEQSFSRDAAVRAESRPGDAAMLARIVMATRVEVEARGGQRSVRARRSVALLVGVAGVLIGAMATGAAAGG